MATQSTKTEKGNEMNEALATLTFNAIHWIYTNGEHTEDGIEVEKSAFHVQATAPDGSRWDHGHTFTVEPVSYESTDEEEYGYPEFSTHDGLNEVAEIREQCEALVAKIEAHVAAGGTLDLELWHGADPVYGSDAYQGLAVSERPEVIAENQDRLDHGARADELIR